MDKTLGIRQRLGQPNGYSTTQTFTPLNNMKKGQQQRPSIGKTSNGQTFKVPTTNDMVTTLLNPLEPKSVFDLITLGCMSVPFLIWLCLPSTLSRYILLGCYLFWRLTYNVGLGVLLKYQSDTDGLVEWCRHYHLFDTIATGRAHWLKRQLSIKMGSDYQFERVPVEYNTWLLFRQLVDLILMNDFTCYFFFVLSWFNSSSSTSFYFMLGDLLRWTGGLFLILFNIWVKLDAHRVVKDFAWYWGDFFFLIEQSLTFDGVFEMAPHPMYSIGYFGYYGLSLISASYCVLFVSIAAHALQFAFLVLVETPHIEKIYNPQKIPKRQPRMSRTVDDDVKHLMMALDKNAGRDLCSSWTRSDLMVFKNLDLFRSTDIVSVVVIVYSVLLPLMFTGQLGINVAIGQAFFWSAIYSGGVGSLLWAQSRNKFFTRHFVKWGGNQVDAFQSWKSIFNLTLSMTYVTFFMACWKAYSLPDDWTYGTTLLRHTLGLIFISLHIWTSISIFEVLGDFGWFYGDFFIDEHRNNLLYTGIYRFLNNPEKIMGHAAFWGMTLIANNWVIYGLALFSQLANVLFLHYVEGPHMQKLYGDQIRGEAGLTKTLRSAATKIPKTIPEKLQELVKRVPTNQVHNQNKTADILGKVEKSIEETISSVNETMLIKSELKDLLLQTKHIMEPPILPELQHNTRSSPASLAPTQLHTDTLHLQFQVRSQQQQWSLGYPIKVDWEIRCSSTEQLDRHHDDWIGIYKISHASSNHHSIRQFTTISSNGRWMWLNSDDKNSRLITNSEQLSAANGNKNKTGTLTFKGSQLPWEIGFYELKLHYGTSNLVLATSDPFEVTAPIIPDIQDNDALTLFLLKSVQHSMGNDVERMPMSMVDVFVLTDEEAKRIAYSIMVVFELEFAWQVISADNSVIKLAKRIEQAHNILGPFVHRTPPESLSPIV
ncbi:phospholipid methyltransferase-domain-containing protein [Chlamydoabsidia padenii]|nr:phospholipid methyltransferase-domain-containing protein [Chlamydoabsidia padenii]